MSRSGKKINNQTGSLIKSEPEFLVVGKLHKPHGLMGGMILEILTDFPDRLIQGKKVFIGDEKKELSIEEIRQSGKNWIVIFKEYGQPEDLSVLRNQYVFVPANQIPPLPEGEYYHHQLIGLSVFNHNKGYLGLLTEILATGANDVYVISNPDNPENELLIPVLKSIIKEVDLAENIMIVELPQWL